MEATSIETATLQEAKPRPQGGQAASGVFDLLLRKSAAGRADPPEQAAPEQPADLSHGFERPQPPAASGEHGRKDGARERANGAVSAASAQGAEEPAATARTPQLQAVIATGPAASAPTQAPPTAAPSPLLTASAATPSADDPLPRINEQRPAAWSPILRGSAPASTPAPARPTAEAAAAVPIAVRPTAAVREPTAAPPTADNKPPGPTPPVGSPIGIKIAPDVQADSILEARVSPTPSSQTVAKGFVKSPAPHASSKTGSPTTASITTNASITAKQAVAAKAPAGSASATASLVITEAPDTGSLDLKPLSTGPLLAVRGDFTLGPGVTGTADANARPLTGHAMSSAVAEQVAVHIRRAAVAGNDRISIRLHPAELGRIQVKLDLVDDGRVRAAIQADRPETLDFMQRDLRGIERALQDAGLKTDANSLSFSLRDHDGNGGPTADGSDGPQHDEADGRKDGDEDLVVSGPWLPGDGRLDIRV